MRRGRAKPGRWRIYLDGAQQSLRLELAPGPQPGGPDVSPYAAAARAADLSCLPPAFIACPTLDLFIEEDIAYATRLARAGVPVELHVYPGGFHGFDIFGGDAPISVRARRDSRDALRRALRP